MEKNLHNATRLQIWYNLNRNKPKIKKAYGGSLLSYNGPLGQIGLKLFVDFGFHKAEVIFLPYRGVISIIKQPELIFRVNSFLFYPLVTEIN